jgi:hypothetical protein
MQLISTSSINTGTIRGVRRSLKLIVVLSIWLIFEFPYLTLLLLPHNFYQGSESIIKIIFNDVFIEDIQVWSKFDHAHAPPSANRQEAGQNIIDAKSRNKKWNSPL